MGRLLFISTMNLELYNKELIANLSEKYSLVPMPVMSVYRAAKKYYGEDNVELTIGYDAYCQDMYWSSIIKTNNPLDCLDNAFPEQQGFWSIYGILIHFPEVTVTNEINQSTVIYDFFARVPLKKDGKLASEFRFVKTTYTDRELPSRYMHSHCHSINLSHPEVWETPCLGSGPIRNTVASLMTDYDTHKWTLFFWELDKYTQVESLSGIPYLKLSSLGIGDRNTTKIETFRNTELQIPEEKKEALRMFIKSYLSTNLFEFSIIKERAVLGVSFLEWLVEFTKYYKKWEIAATEANVPTFSEFLIEYMIKDNVLYQKVASNIRAKIGMPMLTFKGKTYTFTVKNTEMQAKTYTLLSVDFACTILQKLFNYINCCYDSNRVFAPRKVQGNCEGKVVEIRV